jgi:transcriptional regulator with XRE-family HTH domain
MSRKIDSRWESEFARFVLGYAQDLRDARGHLVGGPTLLARHLGIHESSVYQWIRGRTAPRPQCAAVIRQLAAERGLNLTLDQIYDHSRQIRAELRLEAKSDRVEICKSRKRTTADVLPFPSQPERRAVVSRVLAELGK